ncbi:MAG: helix-turn-helix domain-containing protein [Beijerinckiaceae bacterium]|nr:helix-turn-helix domain-containing protein [Beijerinckiaceae bacterium]
MRRHFPLADLETPLRTAFEKIGASAQLGGVHIGVQARSAMRISFNEKSLWTFVLTLGGSSRVAVDGRTYELNAGSQALAGLSAAGTAEMGLGASALISFEQGAIDEAICSINGTFDQRLPAGETLIQSQVLVGRGHEASITSALRLGLLAGARQGFMSEAMAGDVVLRSIALAIIDSLHLQESESTERDGSRAATRAREYMLDRLADDVTLTDLERAAGVSRRTLQMHFLRIYGMSPLRYLREERLLTARDMLLSPGDKRVTDVAFACGFTHMSAFSTLFRERFGASPASFGRRSR